MLTLRRSLVLIIGVVLQGTALSQSPRGGVPPGTNAPPTLFTATCGATKNSYATSSGLSETATATTYVDFPDMAVSFNVDAPGPECVKIEFSAFIFSQSVKLMFVRALFDENPTLIMEPSEVHVEPPSGEPSRWAKYYTFTFILPIENGLEAGGHSVRIQWRSSDRGTIFTHKRTLVVEHD